MGEKENKDYMDYMDYMDHNCKTGYSRLFSLVSYVLCQIHHAFYLNLLCMGYIVIYGTERKDVQVIQ
jgi:hypothetical protein